MKRTYIRPILNYSSKESSFILPFFAPHPKSPSEPVFIRAGLSQGEGLWSLVRGAEMPRAGRSPLLGRGAGGEVRTNGFDISQSFSNAFLLLLTAGLLFFSSCQKVINIDLNSTSPHIVIEGNITDQAGPYTIKLTQTVNFSDDNVFPPVTGASVKVSDDKGNTETLVEEAPGIYKTNTLQGTPGRTYSLTVITDGKTYNAVSSMPPPVNIDSLSAIRGAFGKQKFAEAIFKDSVGINNYYRLIEIRNRDTSKSIFISDDQFVNGNKITADLFSDDDTLKTNDSLTMLLQTIDKGVFNYFRDVLQLNDQQSTSPANPGSNISNGALGYFSAYAVRQKSIVVK